MRVGCLNKNTDNVEYIYISDRIKSLPAPYGKEPYVQFFINEEENIDSYIWDGTQVIVDPNYVEPTPDYVVIAREKLKDAIIFGDELAIDFGSENVALGITQQGKTTEVLSIMEEAVEIDPVNLPNIRISIMGSLKSGSLYETIKVLDYHIDKCVQGDYDHLSPYITQERLEEIKQRVSDFLS